MNRIKISFNRETKKVPPTITTYTQLEVYLKIKAFPGSGVLPEKFKLYYQDREGDLISISNSEELETELTSFL